MIHETLLCFHSLCLPPLVNTISTSSEERLEVSFFSTGSSNFFRIICSTTHTTTTHNLALWFFSNRYGTHRLSKCIVSFKGSIWSILLIRFTDRKRMVLFILSKYGPVTYDPRRSKPLLIYWNSNTKDSTSGVASLETSSADSRKRQGVYNQHTKTSVGWRDPDRKSSYSTSIM